MLTLLRRTDYALVALAALADRPRESVSSTRLAETMHVSGAFLRNILKDLARTELVHAERGPHGGYSFVRDPASISLLMIVEAIEGSVAAAGQTHTTHTHAGEVQ